jgi:hypothetical protein
VHGVDRGDVRSAAAMIDAAGIAWAVEQHPLEAVLTKRNGGESSRVPVPRMVANVGSDTRAVLGVVGEGYEPPQNAAAFAFCDAITDSGEAPWLGAAETRGVARVVEGFLRSPRTQYAFGRSASRRLERCVPVCVPNEPDLTSGRPIQPHEIPLN